jgi:hypothetical protein
MCIQQSLLPSGRFLVVPYISSRNRWMEEIY